MRKATVHADEHNGILDLQFVYSGCGIPWYSKGALIYFCQLGAPESSYMQIFLL